MLKKILVKILKKKIEKPNDNRIGDWVYSAPKIEDHIFSTDLMQIALYKKAVGLKPFISYASHKDRKIFTEDNTPELKQKNLDKLAWLCCPDFSDIKKKSFWWTGVAQEQIDRLLKHYD